MFAPEFGYHRASSIDDATALLKKHPGAKLLAGGHSLLPMLKLRLASPPALIDIGRIGELKKILVVRDGSVRIGALATHAEIARSEDVKALCPALAEAAGQVGDPAVRNRGTIGGNVAHADPASDLPTVLTALGAKFHIHGAGGPRTVEAAAFFQGLMSTAVGDDELLTAVGVPASKDGQGSAYVKFVHPASRYAVIGVAAIVTVAGGKCTAASVVVGGMVPSPVRAAAVEKALIGQTLSDDVLAKASAAVVDDLRGEVLGDLFASADYRRAVAPVWVKRALTLAASRAK